MFITAIGSESKSKSVFRRGVLLILMSVIFLTSAFSVAALNRTAVINVDGKTVRVSVTGTDKYDILADAGVELSQYDVAEASNENGVITIDVTRYFPVYVKTDNKSKDRYMVSGGTVSDLLKQANVKVTDNHIVTPQKDTRLTEGLTVEVKEYKTVKVSVDGKDKTVKVPVGTVKDALAYAGIKLGKYDTVSCKLTDDVTENMEISITRIEYKNVKTVEKVPYETVETYSDKLAEGKTKVTKKGVDGEYTVVTKQTLVNGEVTDEEIVSSKLTKEPVNKEVTIGTKKSVAEKADTDSATASESGVPVSEENGVLYDSEGNQVSYSNVLHGSGTAYYAPAGSLTASGQEVYVGGVAVNPDIIPLGTKLYIVADDGFVYGYATAIDTGGALYDGSAIVDVFYYTYDECAEFGRRDVSVYILD